MDKNVKNGQNDEMDEATASLLSSQKVLGAAARGLVCLNRLICWYGIGGSRDKNINYFLFNITYLHHSLHSRYTTHNSTHTHIYEPGMV